MNIYLIIILIALLGSFLLHAFTRILNLQAMSDRIPEEFSDSLEPDTFQKSQDYTRSKIRFAMLVSTVLFVVQVAFILLGGFNVVDIYVRQFALSEILSGLIYFGILLLASDLLMIPFSLYQSFVIEEKFGFNRLTLRTYILDKFKSYIVLAILGGILLSAIIYIFLSMGKLAWIMGWALASLFSILAPVIYINLIAPLFNRFTPLEDEALLESIDELCNQINFPINGIFVMDGSRRSAHSNAYFAGLGRTKRIVLFDTLLEKHPADEILAILAHEMGHYKKGHVRKGVLLGFIHSGILFYLLSIFLFTPGLFAAFRMENISIYAGLIFFSLLYQPIEFGLGILFNAISRKHEFQADHFAAQAVSDSNAMIRALKQLTIDNLSNPTPHPAAVWLNYSHPPVLQRISAIRKIQNEDH